MFYNYFEQKQPRTNLPETPSSPSIWEHITGAGKKAMDFVQQNPDKTSILLGMIGDAIAPQGAFKGIGQYLGKSSMAAKQNDAVAELLDESRKGRKLDQELLSRFLDKRLSLTPSGEEGITSITVKADNTGGSTTSISIDNPVKTIQALPTGATYVGQDKDGNPVFKAMVQGQEKFYVEVKDAVQRNKQ